MKSGVSLSTASPRALIVEPHDETRELYASVMKMRNWRVDEADDGRVGLALALAAVPDVIISEARLPGISGFDLCREVRRDATTSGVPFVLVTSDSLTSTLSAVEACGADGVLTKPFLPAHLLDELDRTLRERATRRPVAAGARSRPQAAPSTRQPAPSGSERRATLVRAHQRTTTMTPPLAPPPLVCPLCDRRLTYERSYLGGVNARHPEQWDDYTCGGCSSRYQYRQRTRKLRRL